MSFSSTFCTSNDALCVCKHIFLKSEFGLKVWPIISIVLDNHMKVESCTSKKPQGHPQPRPPDRTHQTIAS